MTKNIIGVWKSDPGDALTMEIFGNVSMEFKENGDLIYATYEDGKESRIMMTYQIDGDLLITNQPSTPQKEVTKFVINNGKLELTFENTVSRYIKAW